MTTRGDPDGDGLELEAEQAAGTDPLKPDTDGDGLRDGDEVSRGTDPLDPDSDDDGLADGREVALGSGARDADSDDDTLTDGDEVNRFGSNPLAEDTDGDGISDPQEVNGFHTNPAAVDTDHDSLADYDEVVLLNTDALRPDGDGDGLEDALEVVRGTHPRNPDTDHDGIPDGVEAFETGTDPVSPDTDGDLVGDADELEAGTNPLHPDTDFDGLSDGDEAAWRTNPQQADTDGDGLKDGEEVRLGLEPSRADTDGDGASDGLERSLRTDPLDPDTDHDGVPDGLEVTVDGDPLSADGDNDGVSDFQEILVHITAPRVADTDGDTLPDGVELAYLMDPLDPLDAARDVDGDGLSALQEHTAGTDPQTADTDLDGLSDGAEGAARTLPLQRDSDGDGIPDGAEVAAGADPLDTDSDGDGVPDGEEVFPLRDLDGDGLASIMDPDSDDDGVLDGAEFERGRDPDLDGLPSAVDPDADGDGMPDGAEVRHNLDPRNPADATGDPDNDGLTNLEEIQRGTSPRLTDTDGDGMGDADEVAHGLEPTNAADATRDADRDTLTNADEISRGTDPQRPDTDGDGMLDDREVALGASPLDTDSDDDGVLDGDELTASVDTDGDTIVGVLDPTQRQSRLPAAAVRDTDGDGITDVLERALGTNPGARDSDGDSLSDDAERAGCRNVRGPDGLVLPTAFPTDPLSADTDRDGLGDAVECGAGLDPTRADHDGDGARDGEELVDCGAGSPGCPALTYVLRTDPLDPDTDDDGVPDGFDPGPMEGDYDHDGVSDVGELVDGWNAVVHDLAPPPGESIPGPVDLVVPLRDAPWIVVAAWVGPATPLAPGEVRVTPAPVATLDVDGVTSAHALRWEGPRLLSTAPFRPASSNITVDVTGTGIRVERILVFAIASGSTLRPGAGLRTLATAADTDGDGLQDGQETTQAFWLEAEHFAAAGAQRVAAEGASNGVALAMAHGLAGFSLGPGAWGFRDNQLYSVFVRARRIQPLRVDTAPYLLVDTPLESCAPADPNACQDGGACDCLLGPCVCTFPEQGHRITLRDQWDWTYVATRRARGNRFDLDIRELQDPTVRWQLDRVLVVEGAFAPRAYTQSYNDISPTLDPVFRVLGVDPATPLGWNADVPWGLTDPWEADTDGDGMRTLAGVVPGSAGWLVDGRERALFLNPFDLDSDLDGTLGGDGTSFVDDVTDLLTNGASLTAQGGPDGRPDYSDALDPAPRPLDFDHDGLLDAVENSGQLARERAACASRNGCPDVTACLACPASQYDDENDLTTVCVRQLGAGSLPLCDFADDDRDDDGIRDGDEDRNRNGRVDPGETNPNAWDSDGDCIGDGVERGLVCPAAVDTLVVSGNAAGCPGTFLTPSGGFRPGTRGFVADADLGATRTNPAVVDSDGDLLSDGDASDGLSVPRASGGFYGEDLNCDGLTGSGETGADDPDTDNDLVNDGAERVLGIDPFVVDTDGDRLLDGEEVHHYGTRPDLVDTDGDGLGDGDEARPRYPSPLTNPLNADTDADTISDGDELLGRGPLATCDLREACGDEGTCAQPCSFGTSDPTRVDSDGDGLTDTEEISGAPGQRTNLSRADTDGDGLSDADEVRGTGVLAPFGPTDPRKSDTDGDGFIDLVEVGWGSNPASAVSKPVAFAVRPGGLFVQAQDFTLVGRNLVANGRVLLGCQGRPSAFAVQGSLTLTPVDGQYTVTASGDMLALTSGGDVALWSGETLFSPSTTTAAAGVTTQRLAALTVANGQVELRFDPPACEVNEDCPRGSCASGQCTGTPGPDLVDLCEGVLEDQQLEVLLPRPQNVSPTEPLPSYRSSFTRVDLNNDRADLRSLVVVGASDPADFPWVGLQCQRSPTRIRFRVELGGDLSINPRFNVPMGLPEFSLDGLGSLAMPGFDLFPGIPLAALNFNPALGDFSLDGPSFTAGLGTPSLSTSLPPYSMQSVPDAPCIYTSDLAMISCRFSFTRKKRDASGAAQTQWTFDGRVDVHRHGLIPFQYDARHTFEGIDCAQGINLCQDGQVALNGKVTVPIPQTPGIDAVVDGRVLLDVTTRDGDELFTGFFGTLSFQQRHLALIQSTGLVTFPFPVALEAAQATMAMVYNGDDPQHLVFQSTTGFRFADMVDTNLLPRRALEMFDPNRSDVRGCLELRTGRLQAKGRIYSWQFPVDAELVMTPPFRDGQPDVTAGNIGITGTMSYPSPFGGPTASMGGTLWYDGRFRLTGTVQGNLRFPGLPSMSLPSASVSMTEDSSTVTGLLQLPGLGQLSASGTVRAQGQFNLALTGALTVAGFRLGEVTGHASHDGGVSLQGMLALPFTNGRDTLVRVAGTWRGPTDWSFTSMASVDVPIGSINLGNVWITVTPSGVTLSSDVNIPGFLSIHFAGTMTSFGGLALRGVLSQSIAGLSMTGGEILLDRTDVFGSVEFTAGAYIGFGPVTLGRVTVLIETDGSIFATGSASYAGKGLTFTVGRTGSGAPGASASASMGGCAGRICLGGTMRVGLSGGNFYAVFDTAGTSISVSSNGCVTWYIGADCGKFDVFCPDIPIGICLL